MIGRGADRPLVLAFAGKGRPDLDPYSRGRPGAQMPEPVARAAAALWKVMLTLGGAAGCTLLLLRPSLRDTAAWLVCGGAAGIFPLDRLMERFGIK